MTLLLPPAVWYNEEPLSIGQDDVRTNCIVSIIGLYHMSKYTAHHTHLIFELQS